MMSSWFGFSSAGYAKIARLPSCVVKKPQPASSVLSADGCAVGIEAMQLPVQRAQPEPGAQRDRPLAGAANEQRLIGLGIDEQIVVRPQIFGMDHFSGPDRATVHHIQML